MKVFACFCAVMSLRIFFTSLTGSVFQTKASQFLWETEDWTCCCLGTLSFKWQLIDKSKYDAGSFILYYPHQWRVLIEKERNGPSQYWSVLSSTVETTSCKPLMSRSDDGKKKRMHKQNFVLLTARRCIFITYSINIITPTRSWFCPFS